MQDAYATHPLRIVGSSAVFPFAATVAEHYSYKTHEPMPLVEAIGTGPGLKLFCGSFSGPDGAITSRPMTNAEKEKCHKQSITFEEFKIGQDGLVLIQNKKKPPFSATLRDLNLALSEKILSDGKCIKNPYKTWVEIQKSFPSTPIRVLGPAPTSGTYDVLTEKILGSCSPYLRQDGVYVEAPANENLIVQKILNAPSALGIVTFSFYEQNKRRLHALPIDDILPSVSSIQREEYPLSRPLYLYIRTNEISDHSDRAHYALEFTSQEATGAKGYLTKKGLIPLSFQEHKLMHERAQALLKEGAH